HFEPSATLGGFLFEGWLLRAFCARSIEAGGQLFGQHTYSGVIENVLMVSGYLVDFEVPVQQTIPAQRRIRDDAQRLLAGAEERHAFDRTIFHGVAMDRLNV